MRVIAPLVAALLLAAGPFARGAEDASRAGDVSPEPATLHCLAVRWPVVGDADEDAAVAVRFRAKGESDWHDAYPLFRTRPDPHAANATPAARVAGGWMFAGSIVGLTPLTEYEVKLALKDPDGGDAERTLSMS